MTHAELMQRYCERLGLAPPPPTWAGLRALVTRHLETVPFENLDVIEGVRADLSQAGVLHKVVVRRRGGFCYELNEAFAALLSHCGFSVRRIEARVWSADRQSFGPPFDHLALVVQLPEGEFLTDVGFGDSNRVPLRLPRDAVTDVSGEYRLEPVAGALCRLARADRPLYAMTLTTQTLAAFEPMYRFHRSSPDSIFTKGLICTRATATGRITLSADRLTLVEGSQRQQSVVADRYQTLEQYFGITQE
jgi:N-hydroxyarylamine O-acetyltransferase